MKNGTKALFSAKGSFFVQLANLDEIVERLARIPGARARVDLTLGREVPVTVETVTLGAPDTARAEAETDLAFPFFPPSQPQRKREL